MLRKDAARSDRDYAEPSGQPSPYENSQCIAASAFVDPAQLLTAFFGSSTVGFGVLNDELRFQAINPKLAQFDGLPAEAHIGKTIRDILGDAAIPIEIELGKVLNGGEPLLNLELCPKLPSPSEIGYWIGNYFPIKSSVGEVKQIGIIVVEVTEQRRLEQSLHQLTGKLLHARDEEQRRIARDLHDSINQYHTALKMNLAKLHRQRQESPHQAVLLEQSLELIESCINETRTLSYLLHPPMLDEMGFFAAVSWYVKGFGQRSGIEVNITLPPDMGRLPRLVEVALFRVVQEALTNIHRHAKTPSVDINVARRNGSVFLEVRDHGRGILPEKLRELREAASSAGLGIASMQERIRQLGGELDIRSDRKGTLISASVPIRGAGVQTDRLQQAKYA